MSQPLSWFDDLIEPVLGTIAAVILFVMMCLTCVDVFGRYFLSKPVDRRAVERVLGEVLGGGRP